MTAVYETLLAAVRQHGKVPTLGANEPTEQYFRKLAADVADLPINDFTALSAEAQEWYEHAADAMQAGQPVPAPDGFETGPPPPAPMPGRIMRPNGAAAAPRHVVPKAAEPKPAPIALDPSEPVSALVSRLVIADETLTIDDCTRMLRQAGVGAKRGSVITLRNQALTMLRLAREAGWRAP